MIIIGLLALSCTLCEKADSMHYPLHLANSLSIESVPSEGNSEPVPYTVQLNNSIVSAESANPVNKLHILYLLRSKEFEKSIELYQEYKKALGRHDFEILQQIAMIILEQGIRSNDFETQLTSIFGSKIAGISASIDVLETAILSQQPQNSARSDPIAWKYSR